MEVQTEAGKTISFISRVGRVSMSESILSALVKPNALWGTILYYTM